MTSNHISHQLLERLVSRLYGRSIIRNTLRGELVEQMIIDALGQDWVAGNDYESWDIRHVRSDARIQIKQSAARQTWAEDGDKPSRAAFSITEKNGYSIERARWDDLKARHCTLYIFAWHPGFDRSADHRDPAQWQFYVIPTPLLPSGSSIGLSRIKGLTAPIDYSDLRPAVEVHLI